MDAADFAVNGTAATVTAVDEVTASTVYDVTVSGGDLADLNGTVTLGFASGQNIQDAAGNALSDTAPTGTNESTYAVDNTAPTVDSAGVNGTSLVVTFSEDLAQADNLANSAFAVEKTPTGGSAETVTLSSSSSPAIDGKTVTLTLGAAVVHTDTVTVSYTKPTTGTDNELEDLVGNEVASFTDRAVTNDTADTTAPTVTSIERQAPAAEATKADSLTWRVTFSEAVANVDTGDFTVSGTTATVTAVSEVADVDHAWDVTASGGNLAALTATVTLGFANGQDIEDTAGTALANLTPTGTNEASYAVDNSAPAVTSIARQAPAAEATKADSLIWRVTFDEHVANVDAADFAVSGTTATVTAVDEVTASTVYDVTVSGGDLADLNGTVTLGFASGQNIQDAANNALANLTPTGTNEASYAVDNSAPAVTSIARQDPATSPTKADSLTWRVTFDGHVANVDAADFAVNGTAATVTAVDEVTASTVYDVTVSGGDLADLNGTVTLGFASGQNIQDAAGNALSDTAPTGTNESTYAVDNTAPTVDSAGVNGTSLVVTFSEDLAQADNLANSAFAVEKTPTGGSA